MNRIDEKIKGVVRMSISGGDAQRAISSAAAEGIELYDIGGEEFGVNLSAAEHDQERIKVIAQRCGCDCRVIQAIGGSRFLKKTAARADLLLLTFILISLIFISSLFIWDIEVEGCKEITEGEVLRLLDAQGIRQGTYWPKLNADTIRCSILLNEPRIGWMTVNVTGSKATVLITERTDKPEIYRESAAADLVASRSGVIRNMSVLNGKPVKEEHSAVTEGEVLVSGIMDSITNAPRAVRSDGTVTAYTWYELTSVCPKSAQKQNATGSRSRFAVKIGKNRINFYISSGKDVDECDKIIKEYQFGIKGLFCLPMSIIKETVKNCGMSGYAGCDADGMKDRLYDALADSIDGSIETANFSVSETDDAVWVTLRAQCVENIAEIRELDS